MAIKTVHAELIFHAQNTLGEGPLWHPVEKRLYWVDITAGDLYRSNPELVGYSKTHFETEIGAFCFTASGEFILASANGFLSWNKSQPHLELIWNPLPGRAKVRLNDGKVDPAGRFWAGSIDTELAQGELYRLDPDGTLHTLLHHIGISNGLGWSPDRTRMYYTDSSKGTIFIYDFNLETGSITNPQSFVKIPDNARGIVPDGLCVDAEGCVWSAHWNGCQVVQYDPYGKPVLEVKVPAQRVTSCCFGGDKNDLLFITSACSDLSKSELASQPHAGNVFIYQTNTLGQPTHFFSEYSTWING